MKALALNDLLVQLFEAADHPEISQVRRGDATASHPAGCVSVKYHDGSGATFYTVAVDAPGGRRLNHKNYDLPAVAL